MTVIGYARVSSKSQNLDAQREALQKAGCDIILEEKASGTALDGRESLKLALATMRDGDTIAVTRLDRLGRSMLDLSRIADMLQRNGVHLRVTEQNIDTSTIAGRLFFGILSAVAEFETAIRKERQAEGIAMAKKATNKYEGRKPSIDRNKIMELRAANMGATEIARQLKCTRASVYRILNEG